MMPALAEHLQLAKRVADLERRIALTEGRLAKAEKAREPEPERAFRKRVLAVLATAVGAK